MQIIGNTFVDSAPNFNETTIRFHIIDPIMRRLGYPDAANVYLELEEKLEYPYLHIGRRSKKDLPLGFPDYRAGLKGARGSFIVEAKAGDVPITAREIEQAHSYAAHAQVGANYFVLCNGSNFLIFQTLSGPEATPLADIPLSEINTRFHQIENILSPQSLARNCQVRHDNGLRLADGLFSSARIRGGHYLMDDYDVQIFVNGEDQTEPMFRSVPQLAGLRQQLDLLKTTFELRVCDGAIARTANGQIIGNVEFAGVTVPNRNAMALMGIDKAEFATADEFISTVLDSPTMFESTTGFAVSEGTLMPELLGGAIPIEVSMTGDMFIQAVLALTDGHLRGRYSAVANYRPQNRSLPFKAKLSFAGSVDLELDP